MDPVRPTLLTAKDDAVNTVSPRKLAANRANAQLSTGPRTPAGKHIASQNATKHGLLARRLVVPGESVTELEHFAARLHAQLRPAGALQTVIVDRLIQLLWRLLRVGPVEAGILRGGVTDQRTRRQASGQGPTVVADSADDVAHAFAADLDVVSLIARYEGGMQRQVLRLLHELERLQARDGTGSSTVIDGMLTVTPSASAGPPPSADEDQADGNDALAAIADQTNPPPQPMGEVTGSSPGPRSFGNVPVSNSC
jgi:hypothetical protein